jgi:putative ABC transport system substrate-binding protein
VIAAASSLGATIDVVRASDSREIEAAFALLVRDKAEALLVGTDPFLDSRRVQLATLAARHAIPAIYPVRENVEVGDLMSYGTSLSEVYRQVGAYTVRILKRGQASRLASCAIDQVRARHQLADRPCLALKCCRRCSPALTR